MENLTVASATVAAVWICSYSSMLHCMVCEFCCMVRYSVSLFEGSRLIQVHGNSLIQRRRLILPSWSILQRLPYSMKKAHSTGQPRFMEKCHTVRRNTPFYEDRAVLRRNVTVIFSLFNRSGAEFKNLIYFGGKISLAQNVKFNNRNACSMHEVYYAVYTTFS